jgi:TPR repeat protein
MPLPPYNPEPILDAFERADYGFVLENAMPHALAGNPDAQCTIALLYQCGSAVPRNVVEAERWLLQATEQNSALAWNNLGTLYSLKEPNLRHRFGDAQRCWNRAAEPGVNYGFPCPPTVS